MLISKAFPGKYLRSDDIMGTPTIVTIKAFAMEQVQQRGEPQPVLYYREFDKPMVLNKTNGKAIARLYGDETNQWRGKQVELFEAMVEFQGDVVQALRVRAPKSQPMKETPNPDTFYAPWDEPKEENIKSAIYTEGEARALLGMTAFRSWRDGLTDQELDTIRPFLEKLTVIARQADSNGKPSVSSEALAKIKKPKGGENA